MACPEHGQAFGVVECGINLEPLEGKDAITKGADRFARADVQDGALAACGVFACSFVCHCSSLERVGPYRCLRKKICNVTTSLAAALGWRGLQ